jgi:hypothetical protein
VRIGFGEVRRVQADLTVWDGVGALGVMLYIGSYAAMQLGFVRGQSYIYAILNAAAAACVLMSLSDQFNLSAAAIQATWIFISVMGIIRLLALKQRARFSPEEQVFLDAKLARLPLSDARRLLDLGHWVDIEAGAVLTEELEPVSHLIYVASGDVDIATNGTVIANCRTGDYVGEVTWATGAPATAAAITRTACRCLFFNAHELRRLANKSDAVKAALGASVAASVREKLVLSNVAAAGRAHI